MELTQVSAICKALSDPNRLRIVQMLTQGEKCGCSLLERLHIGQPTLSHHMKVLSECGLVTTRREAKWSYYALDCERWTAFRDYIEAVRCTCAGDDGEGDCCS